MSHILPDAKRNGYAVGAFNILDYASMQAVIRSAEEVKAPVIVQTSVKTVLFWGYEPVYNWFKTLAEPASVPVVLHLDHCKDIEVIKNCIKHGWTSVMIDASRKPFEENMEMTQEVVRLAKPEDVSVEAELGEISGVEDDISVDDAEAHLADPDKAVQFCEQLDLDVFAPAIGTAHGMYKGEPRIAYDRLEAIAQRTGIPIALHGGTGLSDEVFKKCITGGCAKINISTTLKHLFIDSFCEYTQQHPSEYNPLKVLQAQQDALQEAITGMIECFGGAGRYTK
jgi:ketose-bisphosphate aldolase